MNKDEALDLALEALEGVVKNCWRDIPSWRLDEIKEQITAIKQARSLDKMAENARELGLDYEPVLVQQPATLDEMHDIGNGIMYGEPAPVQEPVAIVDEDGIIVVCNYKYKPGDKLYTTPPAQPAPEVCCGEYKTCLKPCTPRGEFLAAQRQWVGLTDEEVNDCIKFPRRNLFARDGTTSQRIARAIEAKLKEKNNG